MTRVNNGNYYSTHIQPVFLFGTYNEDGTPNFCPITWVSSSYDDDRPLITVSMNGTKRTKQNIARTNAFSANLVSTDMLELLDYFGSHSGNDAPKNALPYGFEDGRVLRVPTLNLSRRVFECEVVNTFGTRDTVTYYGVCKNCQEIEGINGTPRDMALLEPVVYSGRYFKLGEYLGEMGGFYK